LVRGGEVAVVEVLDLDEVLAFAASGMFIGLDGPDGGQAVADPHGLAHFWNASLGQHETPSRCRGTV
jgi:hypothetical protein